MGVRAIVKDILVAQSVYCEVELPAFNLTDNVNLCLMFSSQTGRVT